uniref:Uncharacterized protein n=1 Tax=Laticauda laticaudata TaxID=8630 RepID=A0A8C5SHQ7_LATLA
MSLETQKHIDFKPEIFLLGIVPEIYSKEMIYLIVNVLTAARIVFAKNWKNKKIPMEEEVIKKIMDCTEMSKLIFEIREQEDKQFHKIWDLFYQWLDNKIWK